MNVNSYASILKICKISYFTMLLSDFKQQQKFNKQPKRVSST